MAVKGFGIVVSLLLIGSFNSVHKYLLFLDIEGLLSPFLLIGFEDNKKKHKLIGDHRKTGLIDIF